jgi:hypothetical protein
MIAEDFEIIDLQSPYQLLYLYFKTLKKSGHHLLKLTNKEIKFSLLILYSDYNFVVKLLQVIFDVFLHI